MRRGVRHSFEENESACFFTTVACITSLQAMARWMERAEEYFSHSSPRCRAKWTRAKDFPKATWYIVRDAWPSLPSLGVKRAEPMSNGNIHCAFLRIFSKESFFRPTERMALTVR